MTRTVKSHSQQSADWDEALRIFRDQLGFYLDYLITCNCGQKILAAVEVEVRERFVPEEFKLRFMMRTLVRKVIEHLRECLDLTESSQNCNLVVSNGAGDIPAQERLVYFMRDILEFSTRDTSLLIGITDAQVESLLPTSNCARLNNDGSLFCRGSDTLRGMQFELPRANLMRRRGNEPPTVIQSVVRATDAVRGAAVGP